MAKSMLHEKGLPKTFLAKVLFIWWIDVQLRPCEVKHLLKLGVEESHQSRILKYLVVFVMLKFQRKKDTTRWDKWEVHLLAIAQCQWAIGYTTWRLTK